MSSWGKRLRDLRLRADMSQDELAKKLNLGKSTIGLYETGRRHPDFETLDHIARFFGVSTDYILGRTPIRNMSTKDIHTVDDLKRYLGLDKADLIRLFFYDGRSSDDIPSEAVESVLEAIEYARWKYSQSNTDHGNHQRKGASARERSGHQQT